MQSCSLGHFAQLASKCGSTVCVIHTICAVLLNLHKIWFCSALLLLSWEPQNILLCGEGNNFMVCCYCVRGYDRWGLMSLIHGLVGRLSHLLNIPWGYALRHAQWKLLESFVFKVAFINSGQPAFQGNLSTINSIFTEKSLVSFWEKPAFSLNRVGVTMACLPFFPSRHLEAKPLSSVSPFSSPSSWCLSNSPHTRLHNSQAPLIILISWSQQTEHQKEVLRGWWRGWSGCRRGTEEGGNGH